MLCRNVCVCICSAYLKIHECRKKNKMAGEYLSGRLLICQEDTNHICMILIVMWTGQPEVE